MISLLEMLKRTRYKIINKEDVEEGQFVQTYTINDQAQRPFIFPKAAMLTEINKYPEIFGVADKAPNAKLFPVAFIKWAMQVVEFNKK